MGKINRGLLIATLMVFLLSCSLADKALESAGFGSPSSELAKKNFDGQLNIVGQWYSLAGGDSIPYALLVENTSAALAVTKFSLVGTVNDASGTPLPIMNLQGGATNSLDQNLIIYPQSTTLLCASYQVAKGSSVSQVLFNIGPEIEAADLGMQNPLVGQTASFLDEKSNDAKAVGSVAARVSNQSGQVVVNPQLVAAAYDDSGKLIGCGSQGVHGLSFIPAGDTLPVKFPLYAAAKPASVELFTTYSSGSEEFYSGPEPLQVSGVTFSQIGTYIIPNFTVTNTSEDTVIGYLRNYLIFGPNDELLASDFSRSSDFPPGQTFGPDMGLVWQVGLDQTVSRVVVQMHTIDVRTGSKISTQAVTYGTGSYDSSDYTLSSTAKNNTPVDLEISFGVSCYVSDGNLVGLGGGSADLPANSETQVTGNMYTIGPMDDPQCGIADRIEFSTTSIHEELY